MVVMEVQAHQELLDYRVIDTQLHQHIVNY